MRDAIEQFRDAIQTAGLIPPDMIKPDGNLHRFASNGKRGDDAGWYSLHGDGIPAGSFGDWRSGHSQTWQADIGRNLTPAEQAAHRAKVEAMRRAREAEETRRRAEAGQKAVEIWKVAQPASDDHPYLRRKGVKVHGVRVHEGALVIPMRDAAGVLHSLQFIGADGEKRFLSGGRVTGCYFSIGTTKDATALCIAEGFATGATIHEATGYPVAVAFNAGNLLRVAQTLRQKFSDLKIVVCGDLDKSGTGQKAATEAAQAISGLVVLPDFTSEELAGDHPPSDFNDLQLLRGTEAVKRAIANAAAPARAEHQPDARIAAAGDWPDPLQLPEALRAVSAFDPVFLPDSLRPWIVDIAERVQCSPDFVAVGVMVSLAAVVGRKVGIRPKRKDDWLEVPNLWGAIIGRPGVLKSPALRESMRPLRRLEARAAETFEGEAAAWRQKSELAKLKREAERSNLVKQFKSDRNADATLTDDIAEDEPQARRYVVNDCSHEALGVILQHNPNGTLAYRDELVGLLKSLDKEGNESARGFFLTAWSGTEGYIFDRIGRGLNQRIEACCLSLLGSIQPAVIGGYLRQAVAGAGDDGLLSRFQLLVWPDVSNEWRDVDRWPESQARATANETFDRLDTLDPQAIGATLEDGGIPYLRFDEAAQELFSDWRAELEHRLRGSEDHAAVESHLAKYRKLVPALALLLHLADHSGGAVGEVALLKALAWAEYLESHARRAYASVTQAEAESARALLNRIRRGEVPDPFVRRDVYLKHWACLSKPDEVHEAVRLLCDLDWLREERQETGGAPKTLYRINPKARQA